ncbi:MAG: hypothetical protein CFE28_02235 [Alphaproteobacteria bacterium PA2]|nr:MAG: hypothetical protein CFE28_02235 [Alphaproteobacteria bacterium PA2]
MRRRILCLDDDEALSSLPQSTYFSAEERRLVLEGAEVRTFQPGETIFTSRDGGVTHLVRSGLAKLVSDKRPAFFSGATIDFYYPGEFIFDGAAGDRYVAAVAIAKDTSSYVITNNAMGRAVREASSLREKFTLNLYAEIERSRLRLVSQLDLSVRGRLCAFLLELLQNPVLPRLAADTVVIPCDKMELAAYLCTANTVLSRAFRDLEAADLLKRVGRSKVKILDLNGLRDQAGHLAPAD